MGFLLGRFGSSRLFFGLSVVCLGMLLSLGATPAWSQATSSASIAGLVSDEQNAAIPGAEVKLTDSATGIALVTLTNDAGRYVFVSVTPGTYTVLVTKQGFTVFKIDAQKIDVGTAMTINATLKIGSTSTTVEVTATVGADLQTTNATVGSTLNQAALMALPNMGRDVSTLATLQPGTTSTGMTAGAFSDQNVFMLDGGNNSDDMAGNNTSYVTNFTGTGGTQTGGHHPHVSRKHRGVQSFDVQPDGGFLGLDRWSDPDGDQARDQRLSRFGLRKLFRH
jgi:hypothetical protein